MKIVIICIVVVLLAAIGFFFVRGQRQNFSEVEEIERQVVAQYLNYVRDGDFHAAYHNCLNNDYRRDITLSDFEQAHERRRQDMGALQGGRMIRSKSSVNLFTRVKEHRLYYELEYPGTTWNGVIIVSNADGEWRIDGTYKQSASRSLNFELW